MRRIDSYIFRNIEYLESLSLFSGRNFMKVLAAAVFVSVIILFGAGRELGTFFLKLTTSKSALTAQTKHSQTGMGRYDKYLDTENR